jgi:hypothetical protein
MDYEHLQENYSGILDDATLNTLLLNLIYIKNEENWMNVVKYCSERNGQRKYVCVGKRKWYVRSDTGWKQEQIPNMSQEYAEISNCLQIFYARALRLKDEATANAIRKLRVAAGNLPTMYKVNSMWAFLHKVSRFDPNEFLN